MNCLFILVAKIYLMIKKIYPLIYFTFEHPAWLLCQISFSSWSRSGWKVSTGLGWWGRFQMATKPNLNASCLELLWVELRCDNMIFIVWQGQRWVGWGENKLERTRDDIMWDLWYTNLKTPWKFYIPNLNIIIPC